MNNTIQYKSYVGSV